MNDLHQKNCIPCRGGVLPFDISEIHKYLKKVDGWDVKSDKDKSYHLIKEFKFENFSFFGSTNSICVRRYSLYEP